MSPLLQPWGSAAGLFVGCTTTVVGSLRSVAPAELLLRVFVGSFVAATVVRIFVGILRMASADPQDGDT
ncbi:MAG: hypothetical protein R3C19_14380 [Planctomycetaceae bacterium]